MTSEALCGADVFTATAAKAEAWKTARIFADLAASIDNTKAGQVVQNVDDGDSDDDAPITMLSRMGEAAAMVARLAEEVARTYEAHEDFYDAWITGSLRGTQQGRYGDRAAV